MVCRKMEKLNIGELFQRCRLSDTVIYVILQPYICEKKIETLLVVLKTVIGLYIRLRDNKNVMSFFHPCFKCVCQIWIIRIGTSYSGIIVFAISQKRSFCIALCNLFCCSLQVCIIYFMYIQKSIVCVCWKFLLYRVSLYGVKSFCSLYKRWDKFDVKCRGFHALCDTC